VHTRVLVLEHVVGFYYRERLHKETNTPCIVLKWFCASFLSCISRILSKCF